MVFMVKNIPFWFKKQLTFKKFFWN